MVRQLLLLVVLFVGVPAASARLKVAARLRSDAAEIAEQLLVLPGSLTSAVVADLQGFLTHHKALPDPLQMDGVWDYRTQLALQKFLNKNGAKVTEDGNVGMSSVTALQKFLNKNWDAAGSDGAWKLWSDGSFGKKTVKGLTNFLKTKAYLYKPTMEEYENRPAIAITGTMDVATVTALQRFLAPKNLLEESLAISGEWDFRTKIALQAFLNRNGAGISEDGSFGLSSKRALQKFLNKNWEAAGWQKGTLWTDGSFGEKTIKALQTYLNSKRLEWS